MLFAALAGRTALAETHQAYHCTPQKCGRSGPPVTCYWNRCEGERVVFFDWGTWKAGTLTDLRSPRWAEIIDDNLELVTSQPVREIGREIDSFQGIRRGQALYIPFGAFEIDTPGTVFPVGLYVVQEIFDNGIARLEPPKPRHESPDDQLLNLKGGYYDLNMILRYIGPSEH